MTKSECKAPTESVIVWNDNPATQPPKTGTYLVAIRLEDGRLKSCPSLWFHPKTAGYENDWRNIPWNGEVELWAKLPEFNESI